jgi:pimeloyl-ACP methyl ester carboxylesterase
LHVKQLGDEGSPVIILHGWGHSSRSMEDLGRHLSYRHRVYLFDLPGFGDSAIPEEIWGSSEYADAVVKSMDSCNLEAAACIGHSFGGKIALQLAIRHPERVTRLGLIASAGLKIKRTARQRCHFTAMSFIRKGISLIDRTCKTSLYNDWYIPRYASRDYLQAGLMRPILVKSIQEDLSESLGEIQVPTQILWGEDDNETPIEMARRFQQLIPSSVLHSFPGKGHNFCLGIGSHLLASYLSPFLAGGDDVC